MPDLDEMPDLGERIRTWVDRATADVAPVTVDEVLAHAAPAGRRRRAVVVAAVAAALVVLAAVAAVVVTVRDDRDAVVVDSSVPTTEPAVEVGFEELGRGDRTSEPRGTLRSASTADGVASLWADAGLAGPAPAVDLDSRAVVSITISDDLCPPTLESFRRVGRDVTPVFVEPPGPCEEPEVGRTYVVALDRATAGPSFRLVLPADRVAPIADRVLAVAPPLPPGWLAEVWPNDASTVDRSTPEATVRSFFSEVVGIEVDAITVTVPPDQPGAPAQLAVDIGGLAVGVGVSASRSTTSLPAPGEGADGWVVNGVGQTPPTSPESTLGTEGLLGITVDPPHRADIAAPPDTASLDVWVDTDLGVTLRSAEVADIADDLALPPGTVRSIVVVFRAGDGTILRIDAGAF